MTNQLPIRQLGQYGVITDVDPYDLPPGAWSFGKNVRFRNGRAMSAPVFKNVENVQHTNPRYLASYIPVSGQDQIFIGYNTGRLFLFNPVGSTETDYSISGYTDSPSEDTWTTVMLADCIYFNRSDRAPWSLTPGGTQFVTLPNWPANTLCEMLCECAGALVALNITQSGANVPNRLITSSFATSQSVPASWDATNPSTLATDNILAEIEGGILGAENLGRDLIIYSSDQTWRMFASGDSNVFDYQKLPFQLGAMNPACIVEVDSQHYVFGPTDIWVHDGVSEKSICDGQVKDFIYGGINMSASNRCFVLQNWHSSELYFCYVSGDAYVAFNPVTGSGCNRCAVYNYKNGTWSFDDMPYVFDSDWMNLDNVLTYSTVTYTYATAQGSYQDQEDTQKRMVAFVGDTNATYNITASLYAFDPYQSSLPGAQPALAPYPVDTNASGFPYLERFGINLTEAGKDLQSYVQLNYMIPLGRIDPNSSQMIEFSWGAADGYGQTPTFAPFMGYDGGAVNYKIDMNEAGRWLALKIQYNDYPPFTLSGVDLDIMITGDR